MVPLLVDEIIMIADPRILAIDIVDNQEPMIDLTQQKIIIYGSSPEIPDNTDYTKIRKTVFEKLQQAQKLLPKGLRLCLFEGYRSLYLQQTLFDNRIAKVKKLHSDWSAEQIFLNATMLISPVVNQDGSINIPPHSTGGAFDVYLINNKDEAIEMGIHPGNWMDDNDGSLSQTSSRSISVEARANRKIMCEVLSAVGFVNYPTEYWHWSYGDRYWAYHTKKPHALYGSYQGV
jgi:D-alanyl-D-alanine dipeptidase